MLHYWNLETNNCLALDYKLPLFTLEPGHVIQTGIKERYVTITLEYVSTIISSICPAMIGLKYNSVLHVGYSRLKFCKY